MIGPPGSPAVLLESFRPGDFGQSFLFKGVERVIEATSPEEVIPAFHEVEQAVAAGFHAAGFVSYEAGSALNRDLPHSDAAELPLLWFGIFHERIPVRPGETGGTGALCRIEEEMPPADRKAYLQAVGAIRDYIAAGHTYQVNYTLRRRFTLAEGTPFDLYRRICRHQQAAFSAWFDTGRHRILSASPELFFSLRGNTLTMRPMKGTAPREPAGNDQAAQERLRESPKERAENLMIVDLVRNDLSRIARPGTVTVPALFTLESYPTVHQMTSTVTAELAPGLTLTDIFKALFPCGSVTGAPKRRSMEIIAEQESAPRGPYCGAIGFVSPGEEAAFSVAIRTAVLDTVTGQGELGVGSGITWDSEPDAEYAECLAKGVFLTREAEPFSLVETLRWDEGNYVLRGRHLRRMAASAACFGFPFDENSAANRLEEAAREFVAPCKVRLLLDSDGNLGIESAPLPLTDDGPAFPVALSTKRVGAGDPWLRHKSTRRPLYESERSRYPACGEVIFCNERGEITEGSYTNVVLHRDSALITPPLHCGLLPGTFRAALLEAGVLREQVITADDLRAAGEFFLINSVRGWLRGYLVDE